MTEAFDQHDAVRRRAREALAAGDLTTAQREYLNLVAPNVQDFAEMVDLVARLRTAAQHTEAARVVEHLFGRCRKTACGSLPLLREAAQVEKALGRRLVPPGVDRHREAKIAGGVVVALVAGFFLLAFLVSRHQALHLVNPTPTPAVVSVAGRSFELSPGELRTAWIPEGQHVVTVSLSTGVERQTPIAMEHGLLERLFDPKTFVFAILGAEAFSITEAVYTSSRRRSADETPAPPVVLAGEEFYALHDISYAFTDPPETIQGSQTVRLLVLSRLDAAPEQVLRMSTKRQRRFFPRAFAEGQLRGGNYDLEDEYWAYCVEHACQQEARAVLEETRGAP